MKSMNRLHPLTHAALEDLQSAFQECQQSKAEGLILSALVKIKQVHDLVAEMKEPAPEVAYDSFPCAV